VRTTDKPHQRPVQQQQQQQQHQKRVVRSVDRWRSRGEPATATIEADRLPVTTAI